MHAVITEMLFAFDLSLHTYSTFLVARNHHRRLVGLLFLCFGIWRWRWLEYRAIHSLGFAHVNHAHSDYIKLRAQEQHYSAFSRLRLTHFVFLVYKHCCFKLSSVFSFIAIQYFLPVDLIVLFIIIIGLLICSLLINNRLSDHWCRLVSCAYIL